MHWTTPLIQVRRRGATILEVMFAVGVMLFGLIGIAAVIPAAGKLANNSIDFSRGTSIATGIASNFEAMQLNRTMRWRAINDAGSNPAVVTVMAGTPVCIDPLFVSRPENLLAPANNANGLPGRYVQFNNNGSDTGFRRNRFPYYAGTYNPLNDPSQAGANTWSSTPTPRLLRVGMSGATGGLQSTLIANRLCDDMDALAMEQPQDKTQSVSQVFRNAGDSTASPSTYFPGTRSARANYSWFTTIQPLGGSLATANVVVLKQRDRTFFTPVSTEPLPKELPERLALVNPANAVNFSGGAGGRVELVAASVIPHEIEDGSWLMLMKNTTSGPRHAWYRVLQAEGARANAQFTDPVLGSGDHAVWQQAVSLDGPDWTFDTNPTVAALVDGVVSVVEFPVRIQ